MKTHPDLPQGYIVWPEGQTDKAVFTMSRLKSLWLSFWLGLKSSFPNPFKARRVCRYWPAHPHENHSRLAKIMEEGWALHRKHFGS